MGVCGRVCAMNASDTSDSGNGQGSADPDPAPAPFYPAWIKPVAPGEAAVGTGVGARAGSKRARRTVREYSLGEEVANAVTHGVGAGLAIAALVLCVVFAARSGQSLHVAVALVYSITMLLEYVMSTLYHALTNESAKHVFKVLDHSCIYLYIAGSYTPYCLITLADCNGMYLCVFVWAVALVGVAIEAFWVFRPRWIAAVIYLLLGWSVVFFLPALAARLPFMGMLLLVLGGGCYTLGCLFYVLKKVPYMHSVFHLFVLAGSAFQFFSILLFVL